MKFKEFFKPKKNKVLVLAILVFVFVFLLFLFLPKGINPQKEKVKQELIKNICPKTFCAPFYLYECENGFASRDSCMDSFSYEYDTYGNTVSKCGGYIGGCETKIPYNIGKCDIENLCLQQIIKSQNAVSNEIYLGVYSMNYPVLEIDSNGNVDYNEGKQSKIIQQTHLTEKELQELAEFILNNKFFELENDYKPQVRVLDSTPITLSVNINGYEKTVRCETDCPENFTKIYNKIIEVSKVTFRNSGWA